MDLHVGTKLVNAKPMNRLNYNVLRGWELPADENGDDEGYLVEYADGGKPNHPDFVGYVSWSPKEQFDNAYRAVSGFTFGHALELLRLGKRVARAGWNGKGMWLALAGAGGNWNASIEGGDMPADWGGFLPFVGMYTADKKFVPWLASQTDILAEDWTVV